MDDSNGLFSKDTLPTGITEACQLIEEGNFENAIEKVSGLLDIDPDYPGLAETYRTARFWANRNPELSSLSRGKQTADFLMREWEEFKSYALKHELAGSSAYLSAMKNIFFNASEHYKTAFKEQESTADNFRLLLNLATCFIVLGEYKSSIETLEYARSANKNNAKLYSLLGEAFYYMNETNKSLLHFKEAFFIDPSDIDLDALKSKPIQDLIKITKQKKPDATDIREWMPIFGYTENIFYMRRNLNSDHVESVKRETYILEKNYQTLTKEKVVESNIIPRLINKYIWMLDFYRFQNYNYESIAEIRNRLIQLDKDIFEEFFKAHEIK